MYFLDSSLTDKRAIHVFATDLLASTHAYPRTLTDNMPTDLLGRAAIR